MCSHSSLSVIKLEKNPMNKGKQGQVVDKLWSLTWNEVAEMTECAKFIQLVKIKIKGTYC